MPYRCMGSAVRFLSGGCLRWFDDPADDPRMFADLAAASEAVLVEEFDGRAEQESPLGFAAGGHLGYRFDESSS